MSYNFKGKIEQVLFFFYKLAWIFHWLSLHRNTEIIFHCGPCVKKKDAPSSFLPYYAYFYARRRSGVICIFYRSGVCWFSDWRRHEWDPLVRVGESLSDHCNWHMGHSGCHLLEMAVKMFLWHRHGIWCCTMYIIYVFFPRLISEIIMSMSLIVIMLKIMFAWNVDIPSELRTMDYLSNIIYFPLT